MASRTSHKVHQADSEIWPSSTRFQKGERLRVVVQGSDIYKYARWIARAGHPKTINAGTHVIHTDDPALMRRYLPLLAEDQAAATGSC